MRRDVLLRYGLYTEIPDDVCKSTTLSYLLLYPSFIAISIIYSLVIYPIYHILYILYTIHTVECTVVITVDVLEFLPGTIITAAILPLYE